MVSEAIQAGIFNDLGSGSNVDLVVIERSRSDHSNGLSSTEVLRGYKQPNPKPTRQGTYFFPKGTTGLTFFYFLPLTNSYPERGLCSVCSKGRSFAQIGLIYAC